MHIRIMVFGVGNFNLFSMHIRIMVFPQYVIDVCSATLKMNVFTLDLVDQTFSRPHTNTPKPSGEHWCICMWATESLINQVQCENVHFQCSATDVNYILGKYHDTDVHGEKVEITNAKCCMLNKCRDYVTDSTMAMIESEGLKCT